MIVALPLSDTGAFSAHFGASAQAGCFEVDPETRTILAFHRAHPVDREPCRWPDWLAGLGVRVFLASGIGGGAQERLAAAGITVVAGLRPDEPRALVQGWLDGSVVAGPNACEQGHDAHGEHTHTHAAGRCGCSHG